MNLNTIIDGHPRMAVENLVQEIISESTERDRGLWARAYLVDRIAARRREKVRALERAVEISVVPDPPKMETSTERRRRQMRERAEYEATPAFQERQRRWREEMEAALEKYAMARHVEWTRDLLSSQFALGDGTMVTWGDATLGQHLQRLEILGDSVRGSLETMALHEEAIEQLKASGQPTLYSLLVEQERRVVA